jgi:PKD repeat protein
VQFDGSLSQDPYGFITSWEWDFGDGTTGTGPNPVHSYADLSTRYNVILTVEDNTGCTDSAYDTLDFVPVFVFTQDCRCICKDIELRGDNLPAEEDAFGPDGKPGGGDDWGKTPIRENGKRLGKLHDNPENGTLGGEKNATGYAFEVVATVEGDPGKC